MELAIDARWLHTGLGVYTYNLLSGLSSSQKSVRLRAIVNEQNVDRVAPLCQSLRIVNAPIYTIREQVEVPAAARGCDLLHVPHYNIPLLYRGKMVVSIHDLIHLVDEETQGRLAARAYATFMLRAAVRRADHLITVSEFSRSQIIERLGAEPSKVTAISNGVAVRFRSMKQEEAYCTVVGRLPVRRPYFLYVGNLKSHKNLVRFLSALALLRSRTRLDWQLLLVGPPDEEQKRNLLEHASQLGIAETLSFLTNVSDDLLPLLYSAAQFLVLPSRLEGFGLPLVEAMACGTPVVCSRAASLPELGGDAVRYFDPLDVEDMAAVMEAVAHSPELRAEMRAKGLQRVHLFSWDESARRHAEIYCRVLQN